MDLAAIYEPVAGDLERLNHLLLEELRSDDAFIGQLIHHVLSTRGKMVRPALVFLSAQACGGAGEERLYIAAAVELIHVASLIHDDIIDQSDMRRGEATAHVRWGNQVAVLLGDYLFAKSFHLLSRVGHPLVAPAMAHATVGMSQAEIKQIKVGSTPHTNEETYFEIIEGKTARLFSAACQAGALVAGAALEEAEALATFGLNWGMAFQIVDDTLDLTSSPEVLGKPIASDIHGGKITLPMIIALKEGTPSDQERLRRLLQEPEGRFEEIRAVLDRYNAISAALDVARSYSERAATALRVLPESRAKRSLLELTEFVTSRVR